MELKTARLTLLIDPHKKAAFEQLCARQDRTASQVVRQLIREYLAQHGVDYSAAGEHEATAEQAAPKRHRAPRKAVVAPAPAPAPAPARRARRR